MSRAFIYLSDCFSQRVAVWLRGESLDLVFATALLVAGLASTAPASARAAADRMGLMAAAGEAPAVQGAKPEDAAKPGDAVKPAQAGKADDSDDDDDDDANAKRYPQPVRAGTLIGRDVIAPLESQDLLGHVHSIVRNADGDLTVVMTYGGHFGVGGHLVCVPLDSLSLTGYAIQATGIGTDDLKALPVCDGGGSTPVAADAVIQVGLAKPAH